MTYKEYMCKYEHGDFNDSDMEDCWDTAIKSIYPNIDAKDKDIEALRAFAGDILYVFSKDALTSEILIDIAMELKIIDEHGHPSRLLTGAKDK